MDISQQVKDFLMTRRAKLTPQQAGLPPGGGKRRVAGLRREEVAVLAGVSTEYYAQIERGDIARASEEILHAIATALQLDDVERQHLVELAAAARPRPRQPSRPAKVHPNVEQLLTAMPTVPTSILNGRLDLVATNALGAALYSEVHQRHHGNGVPNLARYVFLDECSHRTYPDWDAVAADTVATLQAESARSSRTKAFITLIGELSTRSMEFRSLWATHNVSSHQRGKKQFHHPVVGDLTLSYEAMQLPGTSGMQMVTFLAAPGSPDEDALRLLASWSDIDQLPTEPGTSTAVDTQPSGDKGQ